MNRILILGGGFGGLAVAHTLRELRPDDEIILVDKGSHFLVGFRKTWQLLGMFAEESGRRPLASLSGLGIQVQRGTVTAIEPAARAAVVDGRRLAADALVVALGAQLAPELVPGLAEHAVNVYDPHNLAAARQLLTNFEGGRVGVGVFGLPYKCPPAPYEIALLAKAFWQKRGVDAAVEVFTPLPMSLPIVGPADCNAIEGRLAENGITFLANQQATAVTPDGVLFGDLHRPYDLVLAVPPHRCPDVVVAAGLAQPGGWVNVDPLTLETGHPGVYAIGDVAQVLMANGKPLPKAGVFAEGEGRVVARRIAATLAGETPAATFDGRGGCFLEVGEGIALMVEGEFMAQPAPQVRLTAANSDYFDQKRRFEQERLAEWFPLAEA